MAAGLDREWDGMEMEMGMGWSDGIGDGNGESYVSETTSPSPDARLGPGLLLVNSDSAPGWQHPFIRYPIGQSGGCCEGWLVSCFSPTTPEKRAARIPPFDLTWTSVSGTPVVARCQEGQTVSHYFSLKRQLAVRLGEENRTADTQHKAKTILN